MPQYSSWGQMVIRTLQLLATIAWSADQIIQVSRLAVALPPLLSFWHALLSWQQLRVGSSSDLIWAVSTDPSRCGKFRWRLDLHFACQHCLALLAWLFLNHFALYLQKLNTRVESTKYLAPMQFFKRVRRALKRPNHGSWLQVLCFGSHRAVPCTLWSRTQQAKCARSQKERLQAWKSSGSVERSGSPSPYNLLG